MDENNEQKVVNKKDAFFYDYVTMQYIIICILLVFVIVLFICVCLKIVDWTEQCTKKGSNVVNYDLFSCQGPHMWKYNYPSAEGCYQSPVNIVCTNVQIYNMKEPLLWYGYNHQPNTVILENTGHTVRLVAIFDEGCTPTLYGAELDASFTFVSLCFRWGGSDYEGSEHSINDKKYALELQATHILKSSDKSTSECSREPEMLNLSYFFTVSDDDNPYLDPIVRNLHFIQNYRQKIHIYPFPLSWLCFTYHTGFYSYIGSLTEPPCTENATWFVQCEPMTISRSQLEKFRCLKTREGSRILRNSRPVQDLFKRTVCYNRIE